MGEGLRNTINLRGPGARARPAALDRQLRRGAGLRGPDPRARGRHGPHERRCLQHRHAQSAARRSEGRRQRRSRCAGGLRRFVERVRAEPVPNIGGSADARRDRGASDFRHRRLRVVPQRHIVHEQRNERARRTSARSSTVERQAPRRAAHRSRHTDACGAWQTAPYLHDGSAASIDAAISAHSGVNLSASDLAQLATYVRQIDAVTAPDCTAANPGLVAAYSFDEGTGTTVLDRSGNVNTGTIQGTVAWTTQGKSGGALTFNGTNTRVSVPASTQPERDQWGNAGSVGLPDGEPGWLARDPAEGGRCVVLARGL